LGQLAMHVSSVEYHVSCVDKVNIGRHMLREREAPTILRMERTIEKGK
jgi:hypothetical protein